MLSARKAVLYALLFFLVIATGTAGYMVIENWNFLDSLYMTVITVATVGFLEVSPLSAAGRIFTMALIIMGVGLFFYIGGAIIQLLVEGKIRQVLGRRRLEKKIARLKDHYIICGYGRIGSVLCRLLSEGGLPIVVVEKNERHVAQLDAAGILYVLGDSTDEDNLARAGIEKAKGLVATLGDDAADVFLVLSARQMAPRLFILARAQQASSAKKLFAAGADKVISPHELGARRMAEGILRPNVTSFIELTSADPKNEIQMEELPVSPLSRLAGVTLAESDIRKNLNLIIIAIKKSDGTMLFNPSFDSRVFPGDTMIAVGRKENLASLEEILNPA
ncbi:MAG: potassium channel protein [Thermodesulfobacteriota bacterium]